MYQEVFVVRFIILLSFFVLFLNGAALQLNMLTFKERIAAEELLKSDLKNKDHYRKLNKEEKLHVLNVLKFKYSNTEYENAIFSERLRFETDEVENEDYLSHLKEGPISAELDPNTFMTVSISPFKKDELTIPFLDTDTFVVLDSRIGFHEELYLEKLDIVKISNLDPDGYTWNFHSWVNIVNEEQELNYKIGVGDAYSYKDYTFYFFLDLRANSTLNYEIQPEAAIGFKNGRFNNFLNYALEDFDLKKEIKYSSEYNFNKNNYVTYELKYVEKDDSYNNLVGVRVIF